MYILKKLNREKRVGTAEESATLQGKGWKLIQEKKSFEKPEIEEIADGLSRKLQEEIKARMKAVEESREQKGEAEPEESREQEGEAEPEESKEQEGEAEPEESREQEGEAEPEEKPKRSRNKAKE